MADNSSNLTVNPRSGFCKSNSVFYSKRKPIPLPQTDFLDVTTFILSRPHHGKTAFIEAATGRQLSFKDLWRAVDSVSMCLHDMGIRKGQVILVLSPNSIFFPIVCLSVMWLGAIITTTNPLNTPREIAKQIADSKPSLAFTTPELVSKLTESSSSLPIVLIDDEIGTSIKTKAKIVSTLSEMVKREPRESRVRERVNQNDTATLLYSSGTTGESKGVVSSHKNLIAMVQTIVERFRLNEGSHKFVCTVPMFHIYGLAAFATGILASGSTIIVLSKFEMGEMLSTIEKYQATYLCDRPGDSITTAGSLRALRAQIGEDEGSNVQTKALNTLGEEEMKNEASLARLSAKERERASTCMAGIKEEVLTWTEEKGARLEVTCEAQEKDKRAETNGNTKEAPDDHVDG